jgi:hypothetical protein
MTSIYGKGYEILALFNIDYHETLEKLSSELMGNPNKRFKLSLDAAPLKKKTKGPNYIQPDSVMDK